MIEENLVLYFENSIKSNWSKLALSDYSGNDYRYCELAKQIVRLHLILEKTGVKPQDKVALIGKNSSNWAISFIAVVSYGAVVVPILPDFLPKDVENIVNHSDSKVLLSSDLIYDTLDFNEMPNLLSAHSLSSFETKDCVEGVRSFQREELDDLFALTYPKGLEKELFVLPKIKNNKLAMISYTSGTTGNSKGVMLSHNSLAVNVRFARNNMPLACGDKIVSFLPLAHSYGLAFEFLFPFSIGCHITFLTKTPSPQIITKAFSEIKPRLILSVPLVIEKIYKKKIIPIISKPSIKFLLKVPGINCLLYRSICKKLREVFGGNFHEVVIGGAPFNAEAERFFKKIKFPFTIGYGMTECGPLISYLGHQTIKLRSAGKCVDSLSIKIDSDDPQLIAGEILVKGENVMDGYYKNDLATAQAIDEDGWLHSGDLGVVDKDGNIFIKGRSKSMLLGPSGQNIYPEEIESIINNKFCVLESLVIEKEGRLIALVCPDFECVNKNNLITESLNKLFEKHRKELNSVVPSYMAVSRFIIHEQEFAKTPKRSIKRYLYSE